MTFPGNTLETGSMFAATESEHTSVSSSSASDDSLAIHQDGWLLPTSGHVKPFHASPVASETVTLRKPQEIEMEGARQRREEFFGRPTVVLADGRTTDGPLTFDKHVEFEERLQREEEARKRREAIEESDRQRRERIDEMTAMKARMKAAEPGDQVPFGYAVDLYRSHQPKGQRTYSRAWYLGKLGRALWKEVELVKGKGRWMCSKGKVDAIDLEFLWRVYLH